MCMQDLCIGLATDVGEMPGSVTNVVTQQIGGDPNRTLLIIGPPNVGSIWLTTSNSPAVGVGIQVSSNDPPFVMDVSTFGQLVQKGWNIIGSAAGPMLFSYYEGRLNAKRYRSYMNEYGTL